MFVRQNKRVTLVCVLERRRGIHKYISFNYTVPHIDEAGKFRLHIHVQTLPGELGSHVTKNYNASIRVTPVVHCVLQHMHITLYSLAACHAHATHSCDSC